MHLFLYFCFVLCLLCHLFGNISDRKTTLFPQSNEEKLFSFSVLITKYIGKSQVVNYLLCTCGNCNSTKSQVSPIHLTAVVCFLFLSLLSAAMEEVTRLVSSGDCLKIWDSTSMSVVEQFNPHSASHPLAQVCWSSSSILHSKPYYSGSTVFVFSMP